MNDQSKLTLLAEVLIGKYRSVNFKLAIETVLFRFTAFIILMGTIVIPISFSPVGVGFIGIIVCAYWAYQKKVFEREIKLFDDLIIQQEGRNSQLAILYITWQNSASSRRYDWVLQREPWIWSILALVIAFIRGI